MASNVELKVQQSMLERNLSYIQDRLTEKLACHCTVGLQVSKITHLLNCQVGVEVMHETAQNGCEWSCVKFDA